MEEEKVSTIDVREMALKCTTKAEVYKVLTITGGVYLPPMDQTNCDYIRDILSGDKLFIASNNLKIVEVPHIEGLRIHEILSFAGKHCAIGIYMPEYECDKYPSRKWICNIVNSLIQDKFKLFINSKITESNDKNDIKNGNKFSILPSMKNIFETTQFKSTSRRELTGEMNSNNKEDKEEMIRNIDDQEKEIEYLKNQLTECKDKLEDRSKDTDLLRQLYEDGYIDNRGKPIER